MALFDLAVAIVLQHEGGFVNNPVDKGQATNMGISTPTLTKWLGRAATLRDVQNLTADTAKAIYRKWYYEPIKGDQITSQAIATAMLDLAVLTGPATAVKAAQAILGVTVDGNLGPITLGKLNLMAPQDFLWQFSDKYHALFSDIVTATPNQVVFLKGWTLRACAMRGYLTNVASAVS